MAALQLLVILLITYSSAAAAAVNTGDKVKLEIYYESLCPYCSTLFVEYLPKLFDSDLISITDLKLIPYGNAKISSNGTVTCQHGPYECLLNTVEACAINAWPDLKDHFPFIYCVESLVHEQKYKYWETCFEKLDLDATPVTNCYQSGLGTELEYGYAAETNALQPPHRFVPWVLVDGQPLADDYRNFVSYICKAYKGTTKPYACSESSTGGRKTFEALKSKLFLAGQAIVSWLQLRAVED